MISAAAAAAAAAAAFVAVLVVVAAGMTARGVGGTTWCIARSSAGATALQASLDYACGSGLADCAPVESSGLCYLPNSLAAHASYAYNSFYQRSNGAPGSCDFGGTATVTITDPSYGSCTYPSSASTAGGGTAASSSNSPSNTPTSTSTQPTTPVLGGGAGGLSPPGFDSSVPDVDSSGSSPLHLTFLTYCLLFISMLGLVQLKCG